MGDINKTELMSGPAQRWPLFKKFKTQNTAVKNVQYVHGYKQLY